MFFFACWSTYWKIKGFTEIEHFPISTAMSKKALGSLDLWYILVFGYKTWKSYVQCHSSQKIRRTFRPTFQRFTHMSYDTHYSKKKRADYVSKLHTDFSLYYFYVCINLVCNPSLAYNIYMFLMDENHFVCQTSFAFQSPTWSIHVTIYANVGSCCIIVLSWTDPASLGSQKTTALAAGKELTFTSIKHKYFDRRDAEYVIVFNLSENFDSSLVCHENIS